MIFQSGLNENLTDNKISLIDKDVVLVFDGNSLTECINGSRINQYLSLLIKDLLLPKVKSLELYSYGIGGQKLLTMVNNAPTKTYPKVNPNKVNILVLNEDANGIIIGNYTAEYNLQLMNQYISGARAAGFDYVITWNGWYPRLPHDLYQPTTDDLTRQKQSFDLANTTALLTDVNVDMRTAPYIGGGENQPQDENYFNDYLHILGAGTIVQANHLFDNGFKNLFQL